MKRFLWMGSLGAMFLIVGCLAPYIQVITGISPSALVKDEKQLPKITTKQFDLLEDVLSAYKQGNNKTAIVKARFALDFVVKEKSYDMLFIKYMLASAYYDEGEFSFAQLCCEDGLKIAYDLLDAQDELITRFEILLALIYYFQGNVIDAEDLLKRVVSKHYTIDKKKLNAIYAQDILADLYYSQNRNDEAESVLQKFQLEMRNMFGVRNEETLLRMNKLAVLYAEQNKLTKSASLFKEIVDVSIEVLGETHPDALQRQLRYAVVLAHMNQDREAINQIFRHERALFEYIKKQLHATPTEKRRNIMQATIDRFYSVVYSLALKRSSSEWKRLVADILARWKLMETDELAYVGRWVWASQGDPKVYDLKKKVDTISSKLTTIAGEFGGNEDPKNWFYSNYRIFKHLSYSQRNIVAEYSESKKQEAIALNLELDAANLELMRRSSAFKNDLEFAVADSRRIGAELKKDTALLEFRRYRPLEFNKSLMDEPHWMAMLLSSDQAEPVLVDLGTDEKLHDLLERFKSANEREGREEKDAASAVLYQALLGPLRKQMESFSRLYIVPDGSLFLLPFHRLKVSDNKYWDQTQELHILQTGRDLLRRRPPEGVGMVAVGNVDFDRFDTETHVAADPVPTESMDNTWTATTLGRFKPLPASQNEVKYITDHYKIVKQVKPIILENTKATEGYLKGMTTSPQVLHLATHGFYLGEKRHSFYYGEKSKATIGQTQPLLLSGLALAGANLGLKNQKGPDNEDGILSALEVAGLNLSGTELAVLSACQTGQGVVDYSEGVIGLTQAFRIAGARASLLTLWPLKDNAASAFMQLFYDNWLGKEGTTPAKALRATRLAFLNDPHSDRNDPEIWAPWVLVENGP